MMILSAGHIVGIVVTLALLTGVGVYAGRKVKSAADFSTSGRKAGWGVVAGTIMGTLIGGSSTIGTAQLAFEFGFSAWWFTLGAGIALVILALGMVRPWYESSAETIPQFLVKTYGSGVGPISTVFTTVGILINTVGNVLSFVAVMVAMFHIGPEVALVLGVFFVLSYVIFGGVWGAGLTGILKVGLLYITMIACGLMAYIFMDGVAGMTAAFPAFPWFSLFGRGVAKDAAAGFSLLVGLVSTQIFFQAIISGASVGASRKGALVSAFITPTVGLGGIMVGLFMRAHFPGTPSSEVLPVFILNYLPPVLAGVALATLLITPIASWAGQTLGISTMFTRDIYQKFFRPLATGKERLLVQRVLIVVICVAPALVANGNFGSLILGWGFLSMGLRGCTVMFPLIGAMFFPRFVTPAAGVAATLLGPLANFMWYLAYPKGMDPLYPGLAVSLGTLILVSLITKRKTQEPSIADK
ncbi:MAG: sodium:solute symporter family protein [Negativicutes bacterium]|nr:sodium:solute symporter family protein [Negativicutes bacterium]